MYYSEILASDSVHVTDAQQKRAVFLTNPFVVQKVNLVVLDFHAIKKEPKNENWVKG